MRLLADDFPTTGDVAVAGHLQADSESLPPELSEGSGEGDLLGAFPLRDDGFREDDVE